MTNLPRWLSGTIIALVTIGALYFLSVSTKPSEEKTINQSAPEIEGVLLDGSPFHLSGYQGKVVLLNFWGTWCPPCRQELPDLVALQEKYQSRGFTVIGMADNNDPGVNEDQYRTVLTRFTEENSMRYPNVPIREGVKATYGIEAFPTTLLLDKKGTVVFAMVGPINPGELSEKIEKLL